MDRRYQIFISSTYEDLKVEREGVLRALLGIDCIPASMEGFGAASTTPWDIIKATIDLCDYYLVITAGKYGSEQDGISYTEREYEYAKSKGIPCLAFVHSDPGSLPSRLVEDDDTKKKKLTSFHRKLGKSHLLEHWSNADDLKFRVVASLSKEMKRNPRAGWVRASEMLEKDTLVKLDDLRSENEDLRRRLQRLSQPDPEAAVAELAGTETLFSVDPADLEADEYYANTYFKGYRVRLNGLDCFKKIGSTLYSGGSSVTLRKAVEAYIRREFAKHPRFQGSLVPGNMWAKVSELAMLKILMIFDRYELIRSERVGAGESVRTQWSFNDFGRRAFAYASI